MHLPTRILAPAFSLLLSWTVSAQPAFFPDELVVSASALNLRDKPDKTGKVLEKLPRGSALTFLEAANDGAYVQVDSAYGIWLNVRSASNKTGYVFSPFVVGTYNLYLQGGTYLESLPEQYWYGVYTRDSFADELRVIRVRLSSEYDEVLESEIPVLLTDQKETAKFILSTAKPLEPGRVGDLGIYEPNGYYFNAHLAPGAMLPISRGVILGDTAPSAYYLAATGCAVLTDNENVEIQDYKLTVLFPQFNQPTIQQDLSPWFQTEPGIKPNLELRWFGDLDGDRKPDAIIEDAPQEMGVRISLFLSSKARPGALLHKVCEYWLPLD